MRGRTPTSCASAPARADAASLLRGTLLAIDATALDLRVLGALIDLHAGRAASGPLELTLYQLGKLANGSPPDGTRRRMLRASLDRLTQAHPTTGALIADWQQRWAVTQGPVDFMEVARRRGDQLLVTLGAWLAEQSAQGKVTADDVRAPDALQGYALKLWLMLDTASAPDQAALPGCDVAARIGQPQAGADWMRRVLAPAVERLVSADARRGALRLERRADGSWWLLSGADQLAGGEDAADPDKAYRCDAAASNESCPARGLDRWVVSTQT